MSKIFFNSSMPRSGSTICSNIIGNRPDAYATPTSPLLEMLNTTRKVFSKSPAVKAQDAKQMKSAYLNYCRHALEGYFAGLTNKEYVIDKSRGWAINRPFLNEFYPNPKVICMVRDLREIVASMEGNYKKNPLYWSPSLDEMKPKGVTVGERIAVWMENQPVGTTLTKLKEVVHRGIDKDMLFVRFEDLTANPDAEMKRVYEYLEMPYFKHDFNNIQQVTFEDDKFHGIYGDHIIKPKIEPVPSKAVELLGEAACRNLYTKYKWYFDKFNYPENI